MRGSEFDIVLLRNSAAKSTLVHEGMRVTGVEYPGDGFPVAQSVDESGHSRSWTHRRFVDASGRDTLLAKQFNLKPKNKHRTSAAVFGHFLNVERREGEYAGNISV